MRRFWTWFHALPGWQRIAVILGYMATICAFTWFVLEPLLNWLPVRLSVGALVLASVSFLAWSVRDQIRFQREMREMQTRWKATLAELYARANGGESQLEDPDGPDEPGGPRGS